MCYEENWSHGIPAYVSFRAHYKYCISYRNFPRLLPVAVARSFTGGVAICTSGIGGLLKVNETGMCGKHNGIGACARCAMNSFDTSGRVERDHSMRRELFADVMSGVHVNRSTQPCYLDTQTHIRHTHRAAAVLAHPLWGPVGARGRPLPEGKAENVCRSYVQICSF